ncbi:transposase domain-containing protein [Peribacillus simplex]|uniref:transposase domain-containing protein n=1 Tax=Peribacillus simplex TaxID=1478 RepID=UPI00296E5B8E|nr:transposase domain-containing protein [Peribacillus simplex]
MSDNSDSFLFQLFYQHVRDINRTDTSICFSTYFKLLCFLYSVVETAKEDDLSPYHYLRYLFETLPNMDLRNKIEIDKVLPWSSSLPSACRVPIKSEANKT